MNKSIYRLLKKIIDSKVQGTDIFKHNGSTWIIFENDKQWVIELTEDGTLWYNYNFFQDIFELVGFDVVENQHYITKWVEKTIMNGVNYTGSNTRDESHQVEDTIQNGVKEIELHKGVRPSSVEETIQNGVKKTKRSYDSSRRRRTKDTIQNGIKETKSPGADGDLLSTLEWIKENNTVNIPALIDDVIENGIKATVYNIGLDENQESEVSDVIQNGIKEIHDDVYHNKGRVDGVIRNGVKETKSMDEWVNSTNIVGYVIDNGTKENPSF